MFELSGVNYEEVLEQGDSILVRVIASSSYREFELSGVRVIGIILYLYFVIEKSTRRSFRAKSFESTPGEERKLTRSNTLKDERLLSRTSSSENSTSDEMSPKAIEFIRAEAEIVYSLADVSDIEQGHGGFVKSLKGKNNFYCIFIIT